MSSLHRSSTTPIYRRYYNHLVLHADKNHVFATLGHLQSLIGEDTNNNVKLQKISACGSNVLTAVLLACQIDLPEIAASYIESEVLEEIVEPDKVSMFLEKRLTELYNTVPTLVKLYELTKVELRLCVYNVTYQRIEYISHLTHPRLSCVNACLMAYNNPFQGRAYSYCGIEYIDASSICPMPTDCVTEEDYVLCVYTVIDPKCLPTTEKVELPKAGRWSSADTASISVHKALNHTTKMLQLSHMQLVKDKVKSGPQNIVYYCLYAKGLNTNSQEDYQAELLLKHTAT